MKFIDLEDISSSTLTLPRAVKAPVTTKQPRRSGLAAKWDIVDGKLVCRWVIE